MVFWLSLTGFERQTFQINDYLNMWHHYKQLYQVSLQDGGHIHHMRSYSSSTITHLPVNFTFVWPCHQLYKTILDSKTTQQCLEKAWMSWE